MSTLFDVDLKTAFQREMTSEEDNFSSYTNLLVEEMCKKGHDPSFNKYQLETMKNISVSEWKKILAINPYFLKCCLRLGGVAYNSKIALLFYALEKDNNSNPTLISGISNEYLSTNVAILLIFKHPIYFTHIQPYILSKLDEQVKFAFEYYLKHGGEKYDKWYSDYRWKIAGWEKCLNAEGEERRKIYFANLRSLVNHIEKSYVITPTEWK
jgi:hypothetical protein